jgi:hypothetical protein
MEIKDHNGFDTVLSEPGVYKLKPNKYLADKHNIDTDKLEIDIEDKCEHIFGKNWENTWNPAVVAFITRVKGQFNPHECYYGKIKRNDGGFRIGEIITIKEIDI